MLTTAGVIFLRTGASVGIPLACWMTGSGTLAFAATNPLAAKARPNVVALSIWFMMSILHGRKKIASGKQHHAQNRRLRFSAHPHAVHLYRRNSFASPDVPDSLAVRTS